MIDSDRKEFAELMVGSGEIYNKSVSKTMMQAYFDILKQYSIEQVKAGIAKHALDPKYGTFFPKPADIVRHLASNEPTVDEKAGLAWGQIMQQLRSSGSYGNLELDDKQAMAALKSVHTWKDFCAMPEKDLTWAKKEFLANYKVYENTPLEFLPSSLPGLIELQNHKKEKSKSMQNILDGINQHRLDNKE